MVDLNKKKVNLIGVLLDIQEEHGYLPEQELEKTAKEYGVPIADLFSLAMFYNAFSLKPKGRHVVRICMGTACHVRGSNKILDRLKQELNINAGETTADGSVTLETVNCVGACALGPLIIIDSKYHTKMSPEKTETVIKSYSKEKK